jgi:hypothetical protein
MDNTTLLIILIVVQKPNRAGTGRGDLMLCFRATGGPPMPDDKTKVGEPDRSRVAADQNYEVRYLAQKFGLSDEQARLSTDGKPRAPRRASFRRARQPR